MKENSLQKKRQFMYPKFRRTTQFGFERIKEIHRLIQML